MRIIHGIVIGLFVGVFFAAGYAARTDCERLAAERSARQSRVLSPGTRLAAAGLEGASNIDFSPIETLYMVSKDLKEHYVEQLTAKDEAKMTYGALKAMVAALNDPNSRFLEPAQKKIAMDALDGKFHGIGAILGIKRVKSEGFSEEHLVVVAPVSSGPADLAGLKPGDDIIAVNGKTVLPFDPFQRANEFLKEGRQRKTEQSKLRKQLESEQDRIEHGIPIIEAENQLASEDDKSFDLAIVRDGSAREIKVKIDPGKPTVKSVSWSLAGNDDCGYVRINYFSANTGREFLDALKELKSKDVKGLALDLRNLAGGELDPALDVARLLAPGEKLGEIVRSRGRKSAIGIPSISREEAWDRPVVVIVNRGTARTAEFLASALKENGKARLVGEKTYGDLACTTLLGLGDGSGVMMTTGKFLTAKGGDYAGNGVPVDVRVASTAAGDNQLKEAVKLLASGPM